MPTNATLAAIVGALAPIVAAAVVLFKLNLTQDQQAELVAGLAAVLTAGFTVYASVAHHAASQVQVAKVNAAVHSNAAIIAASSAQAGTLTHNEARAAVGLPPVRVRKPRPKKTPPAA